MSQRRLALHLGVNRKTIVRRFRFLAECARADHESWRRRSPLRLVDEIQFDDLETIEHTKLKPLSVALAVDAKTRNILSFKVSQMPAKGLLAKKSVKKYGRRVDHRARGWKALMEDLAPIMTPSVKIKSDQNPHYSKWVRRYFPHAHYTQIPGGRGSVTGQGELREKRFDPLFSLNHTCAMFRANINRLFRKTWCTTKNIEGIRNHLALYVWFHNRYLIRPIMETSEARGAS